MAPLWRGEPGLHKPHRFPSLSESETDLIAAASAVAGWQTGAMRIATAEDAARLLAPWFDSADVERVVVVHLDAGQRPLAVTLEAIGAVEDVDLPVRAIAASALKAGAAAVVVAHNHPSGNPEPSEADIEHTRRLAEALAAMDVRLVDHLVFAGAEVLSFRALGLF